MNEEHGAGGGNHEVEKHGQRPEVEGTGRDDAEDAEVHGVSDVAIESADDEIFGGIDGRGRPQSFDGEVPGTPQINGCSEQQQEITQNLRRETSRWNLGGYLGSAVNTCGQPPADGEWNDGGENSGFA